MVKWEVVIPSVIAGAFLYHLFTKKKEVTIPERPYPVRIIRIPPTPEVSEKRIRIIKATPDFYKKICSSLTVVLPSVWDLNKYSSTTPPFIIGNNTRYGIKVKIMGVITYDSKTIVLPSKIEIIRSGESKKVTLSVPYDVIKVLKNVKRIGFGVILARPSTGKVCLKTGTTMEIKR